MNQQSQTLPSPFNYTKPTYTFRLWMVGATFQMDKKMFKIIEGTYTWVDGKFVDAIKFCEVSDKPTPAFTMPESEFFQKVNIQNIKSV